MGEINGKIFNFWNFESATVLETDIMMRRKCLRSSTVSNIVPTSQKNVWKCWKVKSSKVGTRMWNLRCITNSPYVQRRSCAFNSKSKHFQWCYCKKAILARWHAHANFEITHFTYMRWRLQGYVSCPKHFLPTIFQVQNILHTIFQVQNISCPKLSS